MISEKKPNVLVIQDNTGIEAVADFNEYWIDTTVEGSSTKRVSSVEEALEYCERHPGSVDVIISGFMFKKKNLEEVIKSLNELAESNAHAAMCIWAELPNIDEHLAVHIPESIPRFNKGDSNALLEFISQHIRRNN